MFLEIIIPVVATMHVQNIPIHATIFRSIINTSIKQPWVNKFLQHGKHRYTTTFTTIS